MAPTLPEKVSHGVEELRDRAAEAIGGDGHSVYRALSRLSDRIEGAERNLEERIDDVEASLATTLEHVAKQKRRASWPRRLFWFVLGAGSVAAFVLSAPERVKELRDQLLG
jgi:hypothetical protein